MEQLNPNHQVDVQQLQIVQRPLTILVYPEDVQLITQKSLKTCRNMFSKMRKDTGRPHSAPITYRDFCLYYYWDEVLFLQHLQEARARQSIKLKISIALLLIGFAYLYILRDDMDLAGLWILVWVVVKLWGRDSWATVKEGWVEWKELINRKFRKN